ncbi:hypothetical protein EFV37_29290 [Mesorhizobium loti]|uniref:hypothetical protein n=1 Tax=Mesorhizobium jarvisii TaxID=1777867 RepID=UPI000E70D652|nr:MULTISPECIES: hypothetical protein [Mesorhizobium]QKC65898.1 hypothetical protein EB229_29280 [Mesorhizobium jarvisii]QKD11812.1 hypothetical protein EFV37_29290 [Mesorhizobium loti]
MAGKPELQVNAMGMPLFAPETPQECDAMLRSFMAQCNGQRVIVSKAVYDAAKAAGVDVSLLQINRPIPLR